MTSRALYATSDDCSVARRVQPTPPLGVRVYCEGSSFATCERLRGAGAAG
jgi:hypothetical protein